MQIAITGGSGFVGRLLVSDLLADGHRVLVLTRNANAAQSILGSSPELIIRNYDPYQPAVWASEIYGYEAIINLAGDPLASGRWTPAKKAEILRSRVELTHKLAEAIQGLPHKPRLLISGSAVGYYGPQDSDLSLDETSPAGKDFLAQVAVEWEAAADPVEAMGIRLVKLRTGIVLAPEGGALGQMLAPFQLFIGGTIGSGKQWLSWIHRQDLVNLIRYALTEETLQGALNGTAPHPVKMAEFCQTMGQVMGRPSWLPVPPFALEVLLGEAAQVVLTGQRVIPQRAEAAGFRFEYPYLKAALQQILVRGE